MIKRQISFLFEDPGFCIDVFCTIAEPVRYYNRDTESGAWYSSTPDWNENGSLIREDLIFEVIADGVVCALDGNGNCPSYIYYYIINFCFVKYFFQTLMFF